MSLCKTIMNIILNQKNLYPKKLRNLANKGNTFYLKCEIWRSANFLELVKL